MVAQKENIKREYCGLDLAKLNPKSHKIKVCNGRDYYSAFSYKELIEQNAHLPFLNKVRDEYPDLPDVELGILIRWLYRGMNLQNALRKVKNDFDRKKRIQHSNIRKRIFKRKK